MENKKYILNLETSKIELHFEKEEYLSLSADQKKKIKSAYLWSKSANAWVSRSKNNHYFAISVAKELGFTEEEKQGQRLTYEEELNRKAEKAENRIERYETYANNAQNRAENLQSGLNKMHGDIAFFTQPNINSASGRSFTNYRNKLFNRYEKGFDEYRKSGYFLEKAEAAQQTADKTQLKDKVYLCNRIKECNSSITKLESNIALYEDILYKKQNNIEITSTFYNNKSMKQINEYIQDTLEKLEYQIDKKAFMQNCLDKLGGIFDKTSIKEGYLILIRHGWAKVEKVNTKTVYCKYLEAPLNDWVSKTEYSEIKQIKIPEDYTEPTNELENPYKKDDILVVHNYSGNIILYAYQVIKTTAKGVQLQEINIDADNKPIRDSFKADKKPVRKGITKSNYRDYIGIYINDRSVSKYIA